MKVINSAVNPASKSFQERYARMHEILADFNEKLSIIKRGGSVEAVQKHQARGKLLPRERILALIDAGTDFFELSSFAAYEVYDSALPAAGIITGIGKVAGQDCMLIVNDATVKGGTYFPLTLKKHLRAQEIAAQNKLPCVYLVDSGGAYLPLQDQVFPDRDHFGRIFFNEAKMSAAKIPQIAVVLGSCTAGGAYVPAMADESIIVAEQGTIFLGGPPLVKAATGEEVSAEELGGGKVHTSISGVSDYLAADDTAALEIARNSIARLQPLAKISRQRATREPLYDADEINGIITSDYRKQFDIKEVIARIVDASEFDEFKANYGASLVCGFAYIDGFLVGIIANNGILFPESALKGAHFIQLCEQRSVPLVFLQNTVGFMVGKKYEHEGIAKHGAKLVTAVATASVPKFTVILGGSFGAGNYAMCGRAYDPNFIFMWPNAKISVMGGPQAAETLSIVKKSASSTNLNAEESDDDFKKSIIEKYEREGHAYYASARLWDDGIIVPGETRKVLARCLELTFYKEDNQQRFGIFRM